MAPELEPYRRDPRAERAVTIGVAVLAAVVGIALVSLGPDRGSQQSAVAVVAATPVSTTAGASGTTTTTRATSSGTATTSATAITSPPSTTVDPGTLPQTQDRPTASGAQFDAGVQGLWQAIVQDKPELAMSFFFPQSAYLQVKSISDPASDYQHRLIANYGQDIHSLHSQLGSDASRAQYAGIDVPGDQAVWVQPGAEYNKLSYWRVYGTTLRYTVDGQTRSFPVTSLISWRGEWYVVHLGAIH